MDKDDVPPFSSLEALRFGWAKTRDNLRPFLMLGAFAGVVSLLLQGLSAPDGHRGSRPVLSLMLQLVQLAATMLLMQFALRAHDDKPLLPDPWPRSMLSSYITFALTTVLYGLIVVVGFMLLIVPGVIWSVRYGFATLLVLDQELDPLSALRVSAHLTRGSKLHLLGFGLLMFVVNVLGALSLGIGLLVTVPTTFVASAHVLRHLQAQRGTASKQGAGEGTPSPAHSAA